MAAALGIGGEAQAARQSYTYIVQHPSYGTIGTYTDTVDEHDGMRRIETRMRIAVRVLGITLHREDADRMQVWRDGRLVAFHGTTTTNGNTIRVDGAAEGDRFVVTSPAGTMSAPEDVIPTTPWVTRLPKSGVIMSTKTGKLMQVAAEASEPSTTVIHGTVIPARHYHVVTDRPQDVWVDAAGIPVRFRTDADGTPIDFVLSPASTAALPPSAR